MARYSGKKKISDATREEALKIAQSTKKPGQTKEQTRLIAQGIQHGIDLYKKQQKSKARELDRKLRQAQRADAIPPSDPDAADSADDRTAQTSRNRLPWILLAVTWIGIAVFLLLPAMQRLSAG